MNVVRRKHLGRAWGTVCLAGLLGASGYAQLAGCNSAADAPAQAPVSPPAPSDSRRSDSAAPTRDDGSSVAAQAPSPAAAAPTTAPKRDCPTFFAATKAGPIVPVGCEPSPPTNVAQ